jgi:hypothetical protein
LILLPGDQGRCSRLIRQVTDGDLSLLDEGLSLILQDSPLLAGELKQRRAGGDAPAT